ncbi:hypothetical protein A3844_29180 [Paenibacillus helianthi]|uniref:DUF4304 domain-containing protein n=2 Tax=Paenibacillus helianthi TaxID=1349432 RepID=A0ABX3EEM6_9BACL|nr:hypothetical protein A3844_29180 [Paenibacillus helianthi]
MSEFSASYHLQTSDQQKAVELIRASNNKGFVFPESNGWVTFIVKGPAFGIRKAIVSLNPGLLVHYSYMEDHGWALSFFEKDELISTYKCDWTEELHIEKDKLDIVLLRELIIKQGNSIEDLEKALDLAEDIGEEPPAYFIANKLGLSYYEWLSADNIGDGSYYKNLVIVD